MKDSQKTKKQLLQEIQQLRDQLNTNQFAQDNQTSDLIDNNLPAGILDNLSLLVCCYDADFKLIYANDAFCRFWNRSKEKMLGRSYLINIPEDRHAKVQALHKKLSVDNPTISIEDYLIINDNETLYQRWNKRAVFNSEGEVLFYISTGEDITRRKQAEQKLDDAKVRFEALSDASFDAIFLTDKGVFLYQNKTAREMFGYTDEEILGRIATDWIIPEDRETVLENIKSGYEKPYEVTALRKDGSTFPCTIKAKMIEIAGELIRFTTLSDSTKLNQYKENLAKNEMHLKTLIKTIPDMIWLKDPKGVYLACNPRFESFFGTTEKEILGKTDYHFMSAEEADFFQMHDQMAIANGRPTMNEEEVTFAADGHREILETYKTPLFDNNNKFIGVLGIARDITGRKEAELLLQKSEEKYRLLFENMFNGFALHEMIFDERGNPVDYRFLEVNDAFYRITGLKPEEITGRLVSEVMPGIKEDKAGWIQKYGDMVKNDEPLNIEQYSAPLNRWYSVNAYKVSDNIFATIFADISDRVKHALAINREKEKAQRYLDIAGSMFVVLDDQGKVSLINKKVCEVLGYSQEEIIGKNWIENFLPQKNQKSIYDVYMNIMNGETEGYKRIESEVITKDGQLRTIMWSNAILKDENGKITGTLSSGEDVTEKNLMMEAVAASEERFNLAMNATEDGLFDLDLKTNELYVSPGWKRMLGYENHELENSLDVWESLTRSDDVKKTWQLVDDLISGKSDRYEIEFKMKHKDGRWIDILSRAKAVYNEDGNAIRLIGTHVDITERKKANQRLVESEEKFRLLTELSPVGIYMTDKNGNCIYTNSRWQQMAGLSEDEAVGDGWIEGIHPDDSQHVIDSWQKMIDSHGSWGTEYRFKNKSGQEYYVYGLAKEFNNFSGQTIGYIGVNLDITERKKAEEALKEATQRELDIVKATNVGLWNWDIREGKVEYSSVWKDQLGYDVQEITDELTEWKKRVHPDDLKRVEKQIQNCFDKGIKQTRVEFRLKHKDGTYRWILSQASVVFDENNAPLRMRGTHIDITDLKKTENQLRLFGEAIANSLNGFSIVDQNKKCIYANQAFINMWGYDSLEDIQISPIEEHCVDSSLPDYIIDELRKHGKVIGEFQGRRKDGSVFDGLMFMQLAHDEHGRELYLGTSLDITQRKEAEHKIRQNEKKMRSYIENAPDGIFVSDLEGNYLEVNPAACEITGYSEEELLRMSVWDIAPHDSHEKVNNHFQQLRKDNKLVAERPFQRKDGTIGHWAVKAVKLDEDRYMAFTNDITETKRLRELHSRAERLETAGTIAGQVAHDFNNLLGPIMAYPEFIRDELDDNHTARAYLDDIENAATKIAEINQDLLTLGRRGHYNLDLLNLNSIVTTTVEELRHNSPHINFELHLDDSLMNIKGGGAQIHRMLVNMLCNAQDAIMDTGNISIRTENYYADDTSFAYGRVPRGEYVKVTISDDGCGIPPDIINRILDPFFSTKTADKKRGSGLGLSVVDAVMKDHNGFIDLKSRVGHGTSFYLYFPITREESMADNEGVSYEGHESVLIIDDDAVQREVSSNLLRKLGYTVTCAESGEQGLEFLQQNSHDLLVLDMVMPDGIDGTETFRLALEINPKQKAIIVSGYAESERVREARQLGVHAFVKKPLTKKIIGKAVRAELDQFKKINS